jgi:DNA-binding MarR family transcriptional regulator
VSSSADHSTPGFLVWRLSMKWRAAVDRAVAPLGLTHAQYSLLASLRGLGRNGQRPSQRQLADFTGLDPIYVSKLVRALEASGLVERSTDPADTRAVRLALTAEGTATIDRAIVIVHALLDELTAPLGGIAGKRTRSMMRDLHALLAVPNPSHERTES